MPFRRDGNERREEMCSHTRKKAVPADQDKMARWQDEEKVAPSLPRDTARDQDWDTADDANILETLRYVVRRRTLEMGHAGEMMCMSIRNREW